MTFASFINCPQHISPKPAFSPLMRRGITAEGLYVGGFDTSDCVCGNSEISDKLFWANLPAS